MKIIEGDFAGSNAKVIDAVLQGPILEIRTGLLAAQKYKIPKDIETIKLLNKDEKRTVGQLIILIILAITLIGLLIAIPLFIIWKRVDFTVGIKTRDGKKFVAHGNASDWKVIKRFIGLGAMDSF